MLKAWAADIMCYFKRLIMERVVNEYCVTRVVFMLFPPCFPGLFQQSATNSCSVTPCRQTEMLHQLKLSREKLSFKSEDVALKM